MGRSRCWTRFTLYRPIYRTSPRTMPTQAPHLGRVTRAVRRTETGVSDVQSEACAAIRADSRLMERANDNVVVNLQDQHVTPFPHVDGRGFAEGGSIKMSSALSGDSLRHANDAQGSVIVPWNDAQLKADIIRILSQWLADEGFGATRQTLLEEAGIKLREQTDSDSEHRKLKSYLLGGSPEPGDAYVQRETGARSTSCAARQRSRTRRRSCTQSTKSSFSSTSTTANTKRCANGDAQR